MRRQSSTAPSARKLPAQALQEQRVAQDRRGDAEGPLGYHSGMPQPAPSGSAADGPAQRTGAGEGALVVGLALLAALLAFVSPVQTTGSDAALTLVAAQAVVEHGSLALDPYRGDPRCAYDLERDYRVRSHGGSLYFYAPGAQLLAVPIVWAGRLARLDMLRPADEAWLQNLASALLIALDGLLIWSLLRRLCGPAPALAVSAVVLLGSPLASTLATALWAAGFAVPLLLLALHVVVRVEQGRWRRRALLAVLALVSVAYTCRPAAACLLPGLVAWAWPARRPSRRALALAGLVALALVVLGALALPHLPPYFSPAKLRPQTPLLAGLYGTLLSPSRGLLVFCPFALPVLAAALRARLWRAPLFRLAAAWLATQVLLLSIKGNWWGGNSYGPRLLTEAVPALGLMAALAWSAFAAPRRGWIAAFLGLGALAVALNSGQGLWNPAVLAFNRGPDPRSGLEIVLSWRYPQFLATAGSVRQRDVELQQRRLRPLLLEEPAGALTDRLVFVDFHPYESGWRRGGARSSLRFRSAGLAPDGRYLLELRGSVLREQPVQLLLQGRPLDEATQAPPEPHAWRVPLSGAQLAGEVELTVLSPQAQRGSPNDERLLGFTFHGLRLLAARPRADGRLGSEDDDAFLRGFADADGDGRWTRDREAVLLLPLPSAGCPCRLELDAQSLGPQAVEARSGDRLLARWRFDGFGPQTRAADLPVVAPGQRLALRLPGARGTPTDPRRLGLRLVELRVRPLSLRAPAR